MVYTGCTSKEARYYTSFNLNKYIFINKGVKMSLENMVSRYGNILKKSFTSKLEAMGKNKTTVNQEDVFASPKTLEALGKVKFTAPDRYDPSKIDTTSAPSVKIVTP